MQPNKWAQPKVPENLEDGPHQTPEEEDFAVYDGGHKCTSLCVCNGATIHLSPPKEED